MSATATLSLRPRSMVCLRKGISSEPAAFEVVTLHEKQNAAATIRAVDRFASSEILHKDDKGKSFLSDCRILVSAYHLPFPVDRLPLAC